MDRGTSGTRGVPGIRWRDRCKGGAVSVPTIIFSKAIAENTYKLPIIVIYKKPRDYPDNYVARLWDILQPTEIFTIADSLNDIHLSIPLGMVRMNRCPGDDPCIVETWI